MNAPVGLAAQAWCTFQLSGSDYGVELSRVREVLRPQPVTRLPLAPPAIAGLMNLRGRIVPVVDPRIVLGRWDADAAAHAPGGLVVVSGADGPVALLVDAIGDVRRVAGDVPALATAASVDADAEPLVVRTLAFPGQLLVVLDLDRVLERAFAQAPNGSRS